MVAYGPGSRAALAAGLLAFAACGGSGGEGDDGPRRRASHLILITVDTLRGDHFLTERAGEPLTPRLRELAERSLSFTNAFSVANCTSPGTAAVLTGLRPARSGIILNAHMVPESLPTLATVLRAAEFTSAAFISNPVLRPGMGFERGFDSYRMVRHQGEGAKATSREVTAAGLAWLREQQPDQRLFLWLHYFDPHGPYHPDPATLALFPKERFDGPQGVPLREEGDHSGKGGIPFYQQSTATGDPGDSRDYLARYAAAVRSWDAGVGELLDELETSGILADAVLVLTSDHGEALAGDHGYFFSHANGLTPDQVHVPLVLTFPGCEAAVRDDPVSTVDVLPTVLDLLGVEDASEQDGRTLLDDGSRAVISQSHNLIRLREGRWSLTMGPGGGVWLYDQLEDPGELHDAKAVHPDVLKRLKGRLEEIRGASPLAESIERPPLRQRGK